MRMRITETTANNTGIWDDINIDPVPVLEHKSSLYIRICNWAAAPIIVVLFMIIMINIMYGDTINHHNDAITRVNTSGFSSTYIYSEKLKDAIASDLISDDIVAIYKYKDGKYVFSHLEGGDNKIAVHCISYDNGREKITIGLKSESDITEIKGRN